MIRITTPLDQTEMLTVGDQVSIDGVFYTARDAAHQKLIDLIEKGQELPFPINNAVIYYVGPCPPKPGHISGAAGPTTASRMDEMTLPLLKVGLKGMVGKGPRSLKVISAIKRYKAVYFAAVGGIGALLSYAIKAVELIAYPSLGPEAIYRLEVNDFPAIVAIDAQGRNIYEIGPKKYNGGMSSG